MTSTAIDASAPSTSVGLVAPQLPPPTSAVVPEVSPATAASAPVVTVDAGARKRRTEGSGNATSVVAGGLEGAPPQPTTAKPAGDPMSDELPYGGSTPHAGAPALKKAPMPREDPWTK